ncbi:protein involved in plasmid replication-relaxation [Kribbella sp. VKM Ac-2527]|uniref:Protein involved in plasmid replication-relaxation n=1 Tax=Kribbella caucasensis TaxID=2512215 RepID=A0A4R6J6I4_9ACTN|nr:replication-relaxation family protein [Kribbella sp. VKM Ac-2527]TDO30687.1 protein involved in plasmid replication-relaxation [Kribbella sp. VKM Ac-2527]
MSRLYVTTKRLEALKHGLVGRDWMVLATLDRVRLATTGQLERLCFNDVSPRRVRQCLASLAERGVITRLARPVGGARAGSAGHVYTLDVAGSRLLHPDRTPRRPDDPGRRLQAHSLAVTELYVRLVEADRTPELDLRDFTAEPVCWRPFAGAYGRSILKPDATVVTRQGRFEDRWFIEVDRATEGLAVIASKCEQYRRYWQTGTEQARFDIFPRVLWVVPDEHRKEAIVGVLGRQPTVSWPLFVVALFDDAVPRIAQGAHV